MKVSDFQQEKRSIMLWATSRESWYLEEQALVKVDWTKALKGEVVLCLVNEILLGNLSQRLGEKDHQLPDCHGLGHDEHPFQYLKGLKKYKVSPQSSTEVCLCKRVCL